MYCGDKQHIKSFIVSFENSLKKLETWKERESRVKMPYNTYTERIRVEKDIILKKYGIKL